MASTIAASEREAAAAGLIAEVLQGRRKSIARMMSLAETAGEAGRQALAEIHRHAGRAHVIGLTGVPGSGKSTMVRALAQKFRASDRTVGIVAVDPSSPFTGGAILGDRIRMEERRTCASLRGLAALPRHTDTGTVLLAPIRTHHRGKRAPARLRFRL